MNWKKKLAKELSHSKRGNGESSVEIYVRLRKEVILPVLKDIKETLCEYKIDAKIGYNSEELVVEFGGIDWFSMKMMLDEGKMKIEFSIADTSEPTLESKFKLKNTKILAFEDVTEEKIGDEFVEAFQPLIKLFSSGKE